MSAPSEQPMILDCQGDRLVAVLHRPVAARARAVLIVVGGPQYRVGSHRYFVRLARKLAQGGHAVLRFDCRGMGDSEGDHPGFERIDDDVRTAIDALLSSVPGTGEVALWGLCDGAAAAAFYAPTDERVRQVIIANPWVRDEESYDDMLLRDYYVRRLFDKSFWRNALRGKVSLLDFPKLLVRRVRKALHPAQDGVADEPGVSSIARRMLASLTSFDGSICLITSDDDLTAREFLLEVNKTRAWPAITQREQFEHLQLADTDHSFSDTESGARVMDATLAWLQTAGKPPLPPG